MRSSAARRECGQATSEFLAAMALLLPLFLGIVYVGKYSDIKHEAIQASRYAAFEQALDPSAQHESANNSAVLIEETRERFFTDGSRNSGKIGYQDTTAGLQTSNSLNPVWNELDNTPMIRQYSDVSVSLTNNSINSTWLQATDTVGQTFYSLNGGGQVQANVEVTLANITAFDALANINLKIGATTVVAGDAWNGGGAQNVAGHFTPLAIPTSLFSILSLPLMPFFEGFSDTPGPQWGCVDADAVPKSDLSQYNPPAPCSNSP
ncbi:MAG TPA: hypothetical protein VEH00_05815 [Steroidobacteraceae bacterium]|nr:hypothetical protein [Steroidobacteraceae bacterium]